MSWSDWIVSTADWILLRYVPAEKDITYQCIPVDLFLALLPTIMAYVMVAVHRLQWWLRRHERAAAAGRRRGGAEDVAQRRRIVEEGAQRTMKEQRWMGRSAQATEAALASLGLFAAGVAALQSERVCALNANTHCLAYLIYRACHALWYLARAYDWISPATADSPLRRWLASPACSAALSAIAAAQVMAIFYEAAAGRKRFETSSRNIWFTDL